MKAEKKLKCKLIGMNKCAFFFSASSALGFINLRTKAIIMPTRSQAWEEGQRGRLLVYESERVMTEMAKKTTV